MARSFARITKASFIDGAKTGATNGSKGVGRLSINEGSTITGNAGIDVEFTVMPGGKIITESAVRDDGTPVLRVRVLTPDQVAKMDLI